MMIYKT